MLYQLSYYRILGYYDAKVRPFFDIAKFSKRKIYFITFLLSRLFVFFGAQMLIFGIYFRCYGKNY